MAPAIKRPAASAAPALKRGKIEATKKAPPAPKRDARLQKVDRGIQQATIPAEAKRMLRDMAESVLLVNSEDRDERMQQVVTMFSSTLEDVRSALDAEIQETKRAQEEALSDQESQQNAVEEHAKELEAQNAVAKIKKYELAEIAREFRTAREAADAVERENMAADWQLINVAEKKAALEAALAELPEAAVSSEAIGKLSTVLRENGFDDSLISSLPTALLKAPDARGAFDKMVLNQCETEVNARTAAHAKTIEEAAGAKAEREQKLAAAQAVLETAKRGQLNAAGCFTEAKDEETKREGALNHAKQRMANLRKEARKFAERHAKAARNLDTFNDGPMSAFAELRDLTAPPAVVEAEVEAEDAPMEQEATAEPVATEQEPIAAA